MSAQRDGVYRDEPISILAPAAIACAAATSRLRHRRRRRRPTSRRRSIRARSRPSRPRSIATSRRCRRSSWARSTGCSIPNTRRSPAVPGPRQRRERLRNSPPSGSRRQRDRVRKYFSNSSGVSCGIVMRSSRSRLGDREILFEAGDMVEDLAALRASARRSTRRPKARSAAASSGRISGSHQPLFSAALRTGMPNAMATPKAATPTKVSRHLPTATNHGRRATAKPRPGGCRRRRRPAT